MSLLTSRQAEELHKSIIAYLAANKLTATATSLRAELNLEENEFDAATAEKYKGLLEKKWTSVIMDLESRNAALQSELDSATPASLSMRNKDPSSWLPKVPPRYTLESHRSTINCIAFHPIFSLLATGSDDYTIKIWDWDTGELERTVKGHTRAVTITAGSAGWVRDVSPSFDGRYLLSAGDDMTARLWDISSSTQTESKLTMIGHEHYIECCAIAPPPAYKHLALIAGLKKPPPASSSAEYMATGSRDKTIRLWDARGTCLLTLIGHDNWIRALVFHPGGKYLLSVSDDKTLRCWDLSQDGRCVKVIGEPHERFITALQWAPSIVHNADNVNTAASGAVPERLQDGEVSIKTTDGGKPGDVQIRCVVATAGVDLTTTINSLQAYTPDIVLFVYHWG
ncbi:hypothetical protein FHL15_004849 [Xylaria flabelliformis]|uniref:Mitochondrial division protein 1 n=1 Tax=Xylaria flabelliformis TaxID=2512241 RepID=A0A553I2G2_9PEZI|nr:hypothetical protein FHL15_004849 [Xylaria flabelliformis]